MIYDALVQAAKELDCDHINFQRPEQFDMVYQHFSEYVSEQFMRNTFAKMLAHFAMTGNFDLAETQASTTLTSASSSATSTALTAAQQSVVQLFVKHLHMTRTKAEKIVTQYHLCSLEMLRDMPNIAELLLTETELIYLHYYKELALPISYADGTVVEHVLTKALEEPLRLRLTICGSFRRKLPESNNLDIVMTYTPDTLAYMNTWSSTMHTSLPEGSSTAKTIAWLTNEVLGSLLTSGILIEKLTSRHELLKGKIEAICTVDATNTKLFYARFYIVEPAHYPFKVLHHTGSVQFNDALRAYAKRIGYSLTLNGLVPQQSQPAEVEPADEDEGTAVLSAPSGQHVEVTTEEDIFAFLGIKYKEPEHRAYIVPIVASGSV